MMQCIKSVRNMAMIVLILMISAGPILAQDTTGGDLLTTRVLTLTDTRPVAQGVALVVVGLVLYVGGLLLLSLRQRYLIAWRASLKLAGWIVPLVITLLVTFVILTGETVRLTPTVTVSVLQLLLPIGAAVHTALIFAPEEEPLEMLLSLPRPLTWLVFERLMIVGMIYSGIGLAGMGLLAVQNRLGDVGQSVAAWFPAMLFLMGFTIYLTTRVRLMTMGLVGGVMAWFLFLLFGPFVMSGPLPYQSPFPVNLIQPFLWMINIFAQPRSFPSLDYYTLNRVILLGLSVFWLWRTAAQLSDSEALLLSIQDRQTRRKGTSVTAPKEKRSLKFNPAPVSLSVMRQITAMWLYEWRLHWRRRSLKVIAITLMAVMGFTLLIAYDAFLKLMLVGSDLAQLPPDQQLMVKGLAFTQMPLAMLTVMQMLVLPVLLSDSVPLDRHDNMYDLLNSTPLPGWVYLVGKVGGVWWASMSALVLAMIVVGTSWFLVAGLYNPIPALDSWLILAMPVILFNGGLATLLGATQPSRRRAVMLVIGFFFLSLYFDGLLQREGVTGLYLSPYNASLLTDAFKSMTPPFHYSSLLTLPTMPEYILSRGVIFLIAALIVGLWWSVRWSGVSLWSKTPSTDSLAPVSVSQSN